MDWVIYCSGKTIPTKNFGIGITRKVWGAKKDIFRNLKKGDVVLFVHNLTGGHQGRPNLDDFSKGRKIEKMVKVELTIKPYIDSVKIWGDGVYPYRFNFKIISTEDNIEISRKTHGIELLDGIHRAFVAGTNLAKFDFPRNYVPFTGKLPERIRGTKADEHEITKKSVNKNGWVYIIINYAWDDWVKVGRTNNLKGRISTYQTGDPYARYKYWGWIKVKDAVDSEQKIHQELRKKFDKEYHGEWYMRPIDDIRKIIERILKKKMFEV